jgi:7-carboxy-7-deazaguanine synthase
MRSDSLRITEIFYSLQGESSTVGFPTVFVRLTGCPLRCQYCDTAYAFHGGKQWTVQAILKAVAQYRAKYVTVSGGEPLAQPACLTLLSALCDAGYIVSLETSGAMDVAAVDPRVMKVIDIKTPDSKECQRNLLSNLQHLNAQDEIKFVICSRADFDWSVAFIKDHNLEDKNLLFSPSYHDITPQSLADWILKDQIPVRFQLQLHKVIWGDVPGK